MLCSNTLYHGDEEITMENGLDPLNPFLINIEDLTGEEWDVYTQKVGEHYMLNLLDESGVETKERELSTDCMESLAHFCRSFLLAYEYANQRSE